jgi:hypothetical protein
MERRYLVAALAIIATFAVFSHGFRTLEHVSLLYGQQAGADLKAKCKSDASSASRLMGKVRTHLRPSYPEEAQLLAEMNVPIAMAQAKVAEKLAQQNMAAARCAQEAARREAERAMRDAQRAQREAARSHERAARTNASTMPIVWTVNTADIDRQVREQTAAIAERIAEQSVSWQVAAEQMQEASEQASDAYAAVADRDSYSDSSSNAAGPKVHCDVTPSLTQQSAQAIRARSRAIVHQVQQSFGYR